MELEKQDGQDMGESLIKGTDDHILESETPVWAQEAVRKSVKAMIAAASACVIALANMPPNAHWHAYALPILGLVYVWYSEGATVANRMAASRLANRTVPTVKKVEEVLPAVAPQKEHIN